MCFTPLVTRTAVLVPLLSLGEKHAAKFKFWGVSSHPFDPFIFELTLYQDNILSVMGIKVWDNQTDILEITAFLLLLKLSSHTKNFSLKSWKLLYQWSSLHLGAVVRTLHSWTSFGFAHFEARFLKTIQGGDYRRNTLTASVPV